MKNIVFTINFNNYDKLKDPIFKEENTGYICFSDNKKLKSNIWNIYIIEEKIDPKILARKIFINSIKYISLISPDFEKSLMVGGQIQINKKIDWSCLNNSDMAIKEHPTRNCIFDEACAALSLNKCNLNDTLKQMSKYMKESFPKKFGLWETGIIFRKNNQKVKKFEEFWWKEFQQFPTRDQFSFPYIVHKNILTLNTLNKSILSSFDSSIDSPFKVFFHN